MIRILRAPQGALGALGQAAEATARHVAGLHRLVWHCARVTLTGKVAMREALAQIYSAGVQSVPLVIVTSALSGIVTSQQGGYQFTGSVPLYVLGSVVVESIILELGPVLTAFVIIGRVGARITAELGTMQVSEQIDAMHSLDRDPISVLAAPRIIAGVVAMPALVGIADLVGCLAGIAAARSTMGLGYETFLYGARLYWHNWDLFYSLLKGAAFGFTIPVIAVHMGFLTHGGAEGVGRSTTASVVFMLVAVLVLDALFPPLLLN